LTSGKQPPAVIAPDLMVGTVYMDVPLRYARFYGLHDTYRPHGGFLVVGPAPVVAGAVLGHSIGASIGYLRAASRRKRRWWGHDLARVVVTATTTWCQVQGVWLRFDHSGVVGYRVDTDRSCVLAFAGDVAPLRLYGRAAWCHAVFFAYLRCGPTWPTAPFLDPIRRAAQGVHAPIFDPEEAATQW
jgi:hypothetical protein